MGTVSDEGRHLVQTLTHSQGRQRLLCEKPEPQPAGRLDVVAFGGDPRSRDSRAIRIFIAPPVIDCRKVGRSQRLRCDLAGSRIGHRPMHVRFDCRR